MLEAQIFCHVFAREIVASVYLKINIFLHANKTYFLILILDIMFNIRASIKKFFYVLNNIFLDFLFFLILMQSCDHRETQVKKEKNLNL